MTCCASLPAVKRSKSGLPTGNATGSNTRQRLPVKVNIHYMIGNHDWYYHLPGEDFDQVRSDMIADMGLSNSSLSLSP